MTPEQFAEHKAMMLNQIQWMQATYTKLELISLGLLQVFALGMPLLQQLNSRGI